MNRPTAGQVEQRDLQLTVEGRKIRGRIPFGVESRDMGGWREVIDPGALDRARLDDLVATVDHVGLPIGRYPTTLALESRADGVHWSVDPPSTRADIVEAVDRGDLRSGSWRMLVARDRWDGDVRHVEEIAELRDVAVVTTSAYPSAAVELRSNPDPAKAEEDTMSDKPAQPATEPAQEDRSIPVQDPKPGDDLPPAAAAEPSPAFTVENRNVVANGHVEQRTGVALTREQSLVEWGETRGLPGFTPEARGLSFDRMIRGLATGDWHGAEEEERALTESPLTAGGHMVPTPLAATVIDKARNQARVFQAGARTVPMTAQTLRYARLVTEGTPVWRNEGAVISDQAMTFDAVTLTARSLAMLVKISIELFEDADSADDVIENSFARQIALELDRVALRGSGTAPEPRGVRNQTGVVLVNHGANGTAISPLGTGLAYDFLLDAVGTCRQANFEPNAVIAAPRLETSLGKLKEATTNAYAAAPSVDVLPRFSTNTVPVNLTVGTSNDASEVYTGDWSQLLVGIRSQLQIRFLQERFADTLEYAFLAYMRADVQLAQPAAFVIDLGVRG